MSTTTSLKVSQSELMNFTRNVGQWVRLSGTKDERKAFDYIAKTLVSFGYEVTVHESDALIGYPDESHLEMLNPKTQVFKSNGYSLSPSTSNEGVSGELIYVGSGLLNSYGDVNAVGKIVISDGLAMPEKALAAQRAGAIGHIHVNDAHIHEMCISPVWGTPTPSTAHLVPTVPSVSVTKEDGELIKAEMQDGVVQMKLVTKPLKDWRKIPTLIAELPFSRTNGEFVLFSGHVDSWHYGVMDNGTANATQLEVARLLAERSDDLKRGIRLAFWSGHSHGRYAGSAWYADEFWQDLHDNCVCHVNVDSVGAIGATVLEEAPTMAETFGFAKEIMRDAVGIDLSYRRISRSSDQSFWGHGIPSVFCTFSEQKVEATEVSKAQSQLLGASGRGGGLGWWWHTTEDLIDKIDPDNLVRDAQIYAETLWQLTTNEYLPFDFAATADEIASALEIYETSKSPSFQAAKETATQLAAEIRTAYTRILDAETHNEFQKRLAHILIPINYTRTGPFDHDLALSVKSVPGLSDALKLESLSEADDEFYFIRTQLVRERNRVEFALRQAREVVAHISSAG